MLYDRSRNAGASIVADADGLLMREDLTGSNGALTEGGSHIDPALVAHALGHILAVHRCGGLSRCGGAGSLGGGSRCRGGRSRRRCGGIAAASQQASSCNAHGAHSSTTHKVASGNLAHKVFSFLFGSVSLAVYTSVDDASYFSTHSTQEVPGFDTSITNFSTRVKFKKLSHP